MENDLLKHTILCSSSFLFVVCSHRNPVMLYFSLSFVTDHIQIHYVLLVLVGDHEFFLLSFIYFGLVLQEDGWVVCRVFRKKSYQRSLQAEGIATEEEQFDQQFNHSKASGSAPFEQKQNFSLQFPSTFNSSMHLPQLLSAESVVTAPFLSPLPLNNMDVECSHNLMKLTSEGGGIGQQETFNGDYNFLDKLLASHQNLGRLCQSKLAPPSQIGDIGSSVERFPFQYLGCESDFMKFSK